MSATMIDMDYRLVDVLNADQLEVGDLIGLSGEVVKVISIDGLPNGYLVTHENEFGEKDSIEISDDESFELYLLD
jgi:hypothetical protein